MGRKITLKEITEGAFKAMHRYFNLFQSLHTLPFINHEKSFI